jgi:4-amino-4-deoxychorismate lyase
MSDRKDDFAPWLGVFETLRVIDGVPLFVPEHQAELQRAAAAIGLKVKLNLDAARSELKARSGRWRWVVTPRGTETLFHEEPPMSPEPLDLSVSPLRLGSQNWDARFKTVSYLTHAQAIMGAATAEVLLLNEHREVASAARGNIFWRRGERLFTPAHETGCRCGVVRSFVLQRREVEEGRFDLDQLLCADEIFLTNSLRGIVSIRDLEGLTHPAFPAADALRAEYAAAVRSQLDNSSGEPSSA